MITLDDKAQISAEMLILFAIVMAAAVLAAASILSSEKQAGSKFDSAVKDAMKIFK